ncbi:lamin tail domain-containing protein [Candidatus Saccharibacteria bacterium]|nr:lamin tail domain-containing protein [Candidatus Saccharibacteria bacterium]
MNYFFSKNYQFNKILKAFFWLALVLAFAVCFDGIDTAFAVGGSDSAGISDDANSSGDGSDSSNAPTATPPLYFAALNTGYKNDVSAQNYDFIVLQKSVADDILISDMRIVYTNSAGNPAGTLEFDENVLLHSDQLVLGFSGSPQYLDYKSTLYSYTFSSSGLASTAGMLQLYLSDQLLDEVCWGKIACKNQLQKFGTKAEDNYTMSRCLVPNESPSAPILDTRDQSLDVDCAFSNPFASTQVYYEIKSDALVQLVDDAQQVLSSACDGLQFSEIFTYYQASPTEQFIEFFNPTNDTLSLDGCSLRYKNKQYPVAGEVRAGGYLALYNLGVTFTKNPTSSLTLSLLEADGTVVDEVVYYHGQKSGTSFALFHAEDGSEFWRQTYLPTPRAENILQEYQACPEGKVINPETGNCIKSQADTGDAKLCPEGKYLNVLTGRCKNITASTTTACKPGYYRNVLTNRCRKITTTSTSASCKAGYERNPETNRCRKIRNNTGAEFAITPINQSVYSQKKTFIALAAIFALIALGLFLTLLQFRQEFRALFVKLSRKISHYFKIRRRKTKMLQ